MRSEDRRRQLDQCLCRLRWLAWLVLPGETATPFAAIGYIGRKPPSDVLTEGEVYVIRCPRRSISLTVESAGVVKQDPAVLEVIPQVRPGNRSNVERCWQRSRFPNR